MLNIKIKESLMELLRTVLRVLASFMCIPIALLLVVGIVLFAGVGGISTLLLFGVCFFVGIASLTILGVTAFLVFLLLFALGGVCELGSSI